MNELASTGAAVGLGQLHTPTPPDGSDAGRADHDVQVISIRRAGPADVHVLIPLIREFCTIDGHGFELERVTRALGPLLADDMHGQVWLITVDDPRAEPDGYGVITWGWSLESGGRDALVDELYLRTRGAGVGRAALGQMLDAAAAAGAHRVFLETERHNERVRSFYARLGFGEDDSVWMSRHLAPPGAGSGSPAR